MPELHPRDIRVVLTAELKGVPTDARIVRAMTSFGAVLDAAGVEVEYSQGPAFDNRCLFPEQRPRLASCVVWMCGHGMRTCNENENMTEKQSLTA